MCHCADSESSLPFLSLSAYQLQYFFKDFSVSSIILLRLFLTFFCLFSQVLSKFNPDFDPSVVLDFLVTCVHLQKQWQCRDRHVPKHDSGYQDVLTLTDEQVSQVDKKLWPIECSGAPTAASGLAGEIGNVELI